MSSQASPVPSADRSKLPRPVSLRGKSLLFSASTSASSILSSLARRLNLGRLPETSTVEPLATMLPPSAIMRSTLSTSLPEDIPTSSTKSFIWLPLSFPAATLILPSISSLRRNLGTG